MIIFWLKLCQRGYTRSVTYLYRILRKPGQTTVKPPNPKYIAKPYEKMLYHGQRVQIDVKVVPTPAVFEKKPGQSGIRHKPIKPYTPRRNGKAERSHRKDNQYFYTAHKFYSFDDFAKQLKVHNYKYNRFPMRPLNWHSPQDFINAFVRCGEFFRNV